MPSLDRINPRFANRFQTLSGRHFRGTLQPDDEGSIPSYDFTYPRLTIRVHKDEPCASGDVFTDSWGRHLLLADHDLSLTRDQKLYRVHRVFQVPTQATWMRASNTVDALTGLERTSPTRTNMGDIWIAVEIYGRETPDQGLRVSEETRRIITGAPIQLGDLVDNTPVKRLAPIFGVWLAELQ